jgi:L-rhamnose-H+ transport protein
LATGFSYANAVGGQEISEAQGNASWVASVVIIVIIYLAGALFIIPYFILQLNKKNLWIKFSTPHLAKNIELATKMTVLNFIAVVSFAYSAYLLGKLGGTVGYAIFNTLTVAVAIVNGFITGEWLSASSKAKTFLHSGTVAMIAGVILISLGNLI